MRWESGSTRALACVDRHPRRSDRDTVRSLNGEPLNAGVLVGEGVCAPLLQIRLWTACQDQRRDGGDFQQTRIAEAGLLQPLGDFRKGEGIPGLGMDEHVDGED
jgi:hypothetical protein